MPSLKSRKKERMLESQGWGLEVKQSEKKRRILHCGVVGVTIGVVGVHHGYQPYVTD